LAVVGMKKPERPRRTDKSRTLKNPQKTVASNIKGTPHNSSGQMFNH